MIFDFSDLTRFPEPRPGPDASLEEHLLYLKRYIFDLPYPNDEKREVHDVKHATRALLHTNSLFNILRHLNIAEEFTVPFVKDKELYLATLLAEYLHDSGREGDGEDLWDKDSGIIVYHYLTQILGISKIKAKWLAEAVANKDFKRNNHYFILEQKPEGGVEWKEVPLAEVETKDEFRIPLQLAHFIQYGDCIDIHRCLKEEVFDTNFLDIYTLFPVQFEELLPKILIEERRLLELMGDGPTTTNPQSQAHYQTDDCFLRTRELIAKQCHSLAQFSLPLPFSKHVPPVSSPASANMFQQAMDNGALLYRGVVAGPAYYAVSDGKPRQTLAEIEIDRVISPEGNPERSTTLIGCGAKVFSSVGGLIRNPTLDRTTSVNKSDSGTGYKCKRNVESLTWFEKQQKFNELQRDRRFGKGVGRVNEIEYNIDHYDAIGYTLDPTIHEDFATKDTPVHPRTAILKAQYLRQVYAKQSKSTTLLPLYEFSNLQHYCVERHFSDDEIVQLWKEACRHWLQYELQQVRHRKVNPWTLSLDDLKIYITFNAKKMELLTGAGKVIHLPPDLLYSDDLKARVNTAISAVREELYQAHCSAAITQPLVEELDKLSEDSVANTGKYDSNKSEAIRRLIIKLRAHNLLDKNTARVKKLIGNHFQHFINAQFHENDLIPLFSLKNLVVGQIMLYKMTCVWSHENNLVMDYVKQYLIKPYHEAINKETISVCKKQLIHDLLELAVECADSALIEQIYKQYFPVMSTLVSTRTLDARECELFYSFCKLAKKKTPENKEIYRKLIASVPFNTPNECDLTGERCAFFGFNAEYEAILSEYIDKGYPQVAEEKLTELLTAKHPHIQLRPLNHLLNTCFNRDIRIRLNDVFAVMDSIDSYHMDFSGNAFGVQAPLQLSYFLMFLVNTESMCNQQYSAAQLVSIQKKIEQIISANPFTTWSLNEFEKCLTINGKRDYLGFISIVVKQAFVTHVIKIDDLKSFDRYFEFLQKQGLSLEAMHTLQQRRAELVAKATPKDHYISTPANFFPPSKEAALPATMKGDTASLDTAAVITTAIPTIVPMTSSSP